VTIAKRPSVGRDARTEASDLPDGTSDFFFEGGLNYPNQIETAHEISFLARRLWARFLNCRTPRRVHVGSPWLDASARLTVSRGQELSKFSPRRVPKAREDASLNF
jgi:hypothetical protein